MSFGHMNIADMNNANINNADINNADMMDDGTLLHTVWLGLGTNLGDRAGNLAVGRRLLNERGVRIVAESSIYSTAPWGGVEQPDFLNQVVAAETMLPPEELLRVVKQIESDAGRVPTIFWGPRVLDIDILLYDELTFAAKELTIPHREIKHRAFVLVPLVELLETAKKADATLGMSALAAKMPKMPDGTDFSVLLSELPQEEIDGVRLWIGESCESGDNQTAK